MILFLFCTVLYVLFGKQCSDRESAYHQTIRTLRHIASRSSRVVYGRTVQSPSETDPTHRPHALILSGAGRYSDPWHPFAETSARIADVLRDAGIDVDVREEIDESLAALAAHPIDTDAQDVDLLVVNVGNPGELDPADAASREGLLAHVGGGGAVLSMHVSATSFPGIPEWEAIMGGIWVRGATMHPDAGLSQIKVYPDRHAIVAPLRDFEVFDERYSYLRIADDVVPLATHEHDSIEHPLFWAREFGTARVVYDALGHDARSYESAEHRELIARAAGWLVGDL